MRIVCALLAVLLVSLTCVAQKPEIASTFPPPENLTVVTGGITMRDFEALRSAVDSDTSLQQDGSYLPSQFGQLAVSPMDFGLVARGFVVSFGHSQFCGATGNCPMSVFLPRKGTYYDALDFGGFGFALVPSASSVPALISAWNIGGEEDLKRYHFDHGKFVADACETTHPRDDSDNSQTVDLRPCESAKNSVTFPPPKSWDEGMSFPTFDELQRLRPLLSADLSAASSQSFVDTPVIALLHWIIAASKSIDRLGNAELSVYPRLSDVVQTTSTGAGTAVSVTTGAQPQIGSAVLRAVRGWAVAEDYTNIAGHGALNWPALIIASWMAPKELKLSLYHGALMPEACEVVTPKQGSWPAQWSPSQLQVHAIPCSAPSSRQIAG